MSVPTFTDSAAWTGVIAAAGMIPVAPGGLFGGPVVNRLGSRSVGVAAASLIGASPSLLTPSPCWTHRP